MREERQQRENQAFIDQWKSGGLGYTLAGNRINSFSPPGVMLNMPAVPVTPGTLAVAPKTTSTQTEENHFVTRVAGGLAGAYDTGKDVVVGLGTLAGSATLMVGDILTFGYNHDSDVI